MRRPRTQIEKNVYKISDSIFKKCAKAIINREAYFISYFTSALASASAELTATATQMSSSAERTSSESKIAN